MPSEKLLIGELILTARMCRTLKTKLLLKHGLYSGQDRLLKSLETEDGQTMGMLARALDVRPPTVTKMVTRMSTQGFVARKASDTDSRQSHVFITSAGKKLLNKIDKAWRKTEKTALIRVKPKRRKKLLKTFRRINGNLVEYQNAKEAAA